MATASASSSPPASRPGFWARLKIELAGLAADFWKDPPSPPKVVANKGAGTGSRCGGGFSSVLETVDSDSSTPESSEEGLWRADPIQVVQKIWGEGYISPGGDAFIERMISDAGEAPKGRVLDLSAGLGGGARYLAGKFGANVTGFEPDALLAKRAMMLSLAAGKAKNVGISPYDPEAFVADKKYDCVIARELFCCVIGKARFFRQVADSLEKDGVLVFTDYLLEDQAHKSDEVAAWLGARRKASPYSLQEMQEAWASVGLQLIGAVDETELFQHEIIHRLSAFTLFLSTCKLESKTKVHVLREIDCWAKSVAALKGGLRFARFAFRRK